LRRWRQTCGTWAAISSRRPANSSNCPRFDFLLLLIGPIYLYNNYCGSGSLLISLLCIWIVISNTPRKFKNHEISFFGGRKSYLGSYNPQLKYKKTLKTTHDNKIVKTFVCRIIFTSFGLEKARIRICIDLKP